MSGLINLIILYIIFSTFSSFVKKLQQQKTQQPKGLKTAGKVSRPQPEKAPEMTLEDALSVPSQQEPPPLEDILALDDDEIELYEENILAEPVAELSPLPKLPSATHKKPRQAASLLSFDGGSYTKGIILSEILGPPVSRRQSRRRV